MAGRGEGGFVGRVDALAAMAEELRAAAAGTPRIVWVEGEAGIGKTSLVRQFCAAVDASPVWVSGAEDEGSLPLGVAAQLYRRLGVDDDTLATATGGTDAVAVGARLLAALGERDGVGVLIVDDLHWADAESAAALLFALRRLQGDALLVVLTTRPDPVEALGDAWGRLQRNDQQVRRIVLTGLAADEVADLAELTVGRRLSAPAAERLHAHTRGHPLHTRALLDELGAAGLEVANRVLPAPRSLASQIAAQVTGLPAPARDLAAAAAVLGSWIPLSVAATVADVRDPVPALEAALDQGLMIRAPSDDVGFPHPLVRAAIYSDLSPTRRRELHLRAASVTGGVTSLEHRVAAAGGPDAALARELEAVAEDEMAAGRGTAAARHFRAAAALWAAVADRDRATLAAVEAVVDDPARLASLRPVVEGCEDSPRRRYALALVEFASGRLAAAETLGAEAVAGFAGEVGGPTAVARRASAFLAAVQMLRGRFAEAVASAQVVLGSELGWGESYARMALAAGLIRLGRFDELSELRAELAAPAAAGDVDALAVSGMLKLWADDADGAVVDLLAMARHARSGRSPRLLGYALGSLCDACYQVGRWDDAVVYGELAVTLCRDTDDLLGLQQAHALASYVHAGRGQFEVAEAHVDAAAEIDGVLPTWGGAMHVVNAAATLARARRDADGMRRAVSDLVDGPLCASLESTGWWVWRVLLAEALLGVGEIDAARQTVSDLEQVIDGGDRVAAAGANAARLRGELAAAVGDLPAAREAYEAGLAQPGTQPLPTARLELAYGALLRRLGERRTAVDQLRRARQRFAALGARPYLAQCDEELTACGLPAAGPDHNPLGLTAAELAVAHLVAEGLSNREVAGRLYVSAKAVEYHLGNIFAKLGISSRRELAGRVSSTGS